MKTLLSIFVTALLFVAAPPNTKAAESVSIDVFYDNLEPYGSWLEVGDYGYVWQPRDVDPDWRPYSDGRWVYTDAGWTWNSDEPYGWAVYHYGRWANIDQVGWVWVPGTEWGPGWVSWRHSPKYVGWAPLPPEAEFREDTGFSEWVDDYYDIGPQNYCFVEIRNLGAPRLRTVFVNRSENITIIQQTTNITHITYQNNIVFNGGIGYDEVSRFSTEPIRRLKLERREQFDGDPRHLSGDRLRARIEGNSLSVVAVPFMHSSVAPRTVGRRVERAEINHGWRNAGPAAEVAAVRAKFKSEAKAPANLPPRPKFERPAGRDSNADGRRPGDRAPGADQPGNSKMRGDDIARRQGNQPSAEKKPNGNEPPMALPEGTKSDRNRKPGQPPEPSSRDGRGKMTEPPATRPTDNPETNTPRRPEGTPPGKMKETPRGRTTDEPETNTPRRPGGAPADIPGREGRGKPNDPQRPRTGDNAEGSSVKRPGVRSPAEQPGAASKPTEPPARRGDSEPPKARGTEQPKRADIEPAKPRLAAPPAREPNAEPTDRSKSTEPQERGPKKPDAERPSARPQGSPNTNSQQERGRGNPGGKEKKKPDENAR